jgi:hypothetical protein
MSRVIFGTVMEIKKHTINGKFGKEIKFLGRCESEQTIKNIIRFPR